MKHRRKKMLDGTPRGAGLARAAWWCVAATAAAGVLGGCRGDREEKPPRQFFPDLDDQYKWRPQGRSEFFSDGRMMRRPVAGTVGFGRVGFARRVLEEEPEWASRWLEERRDLLKEGEAAYRGFTRDEKGQVTYTAKIPIAVDAALLDLGQKKYGIYCSACHGYAGDGQGMIGRQWSYGLPTFHDPKYKAPDPNDAAGQLYKDGYIFYTARNGKLNPQGQQLMPGYGHALTEREGWAVVAYIRALQASREGAMGDLPAPMQDEIRRRTPAGGNP